MAEESGSFINIQRASYVFTGWMNCHYGGCIRLNKMASRTT
jgi:hypothetical protein